MNRIYLAQNPIIYSYPSADYALMKVAVSVYTYPYRGSPVYAAQKTAPFYSGEARVNLSDVAASVVPQAKLSMPDAVQEVAMYPYLFSVRITIYDENGVTMDAGGDSFYAFPGGISNAAFRQLEAQGKNVFDNRLLTTNPFLTNASVVRLTEATMRACPLYLYATEDDAALRVTYKDKNANDALWEYRFAETDSCIRAVSVPALLAALEAEAGASPRAFKVEVVLTSTAAELNLDSHEPQEHTLEWKRAVNEDKITVL